MSARNASSDAWTGGVFAQPTRAGRLLRGSIQFARRKPLGAFGAVMIAGLVFVAAFGSWLAPYGANESLRNPDTERIVTYQPPAGDHVLGTDQYGRDVFSRILLGARTTVLVAVVSMAVATVGAMALGVLSAYVGGWTDLIIQRLMDALMAFPGLILAMMVIAFFGSSWLILFLTIGVLFIGGFQRIVRSAVLEVRSTMYMEAARSAGASHARLILVHILPNIMSVLIVVVSIGMGAVVIVEASLSYLGLGPPAPTPSWGRDFADGRTVLRAFWWVGLFPGIAIALVVVAFNLLGDALRDVLDPRMRGVG